MFQDLGGMDPPGGEGHLGPLVQVAAGRHRKTKPFQEGEKGVEQMDTSGEAQGVLGRAGVLCYSHKVCEGRRNSGSGFRELGMQGVAFLFIITATSGFPSSVRGIQIRTGGGEGLSQFHFSL